MTHSRSKVKGRTRLRYIHVMSHAQNQVEAKMLALENPDTDQEKAQGNTHSSTAQQVEKRVGLAGTTGPARTNIPAHPPTLPASVRHNLPSPDHPKRLRYIEIGGTR